MNKEKKIIIYFAGGTMSGVFGAGVAQAFEEHNLYPRIKAVYAASAGAMTGAYFLAHQTRLGSSIYWEDLNNNFILLKDFWIGVWQRFQNEFIRRVPADRMRDAMNIGYLMEKVRTEKVLDTDKVIAGPIPLYIKLFNLEKHTMEYVDIRRPDILNLLKVSVNAFPYMHEVSLIDDKRYIDAAMSDIIGVEHLINTHPDDWIVVVLNSPLKRKWEYWLKNVIEGKFMQWMFDDRRMYRLFAHAEKRLQKDLERINTHPNAILITPPYELNLKSRTTKSELLQEAWEAGRVAGTKALTALT